MPESDKQQLPLFESNDADACEKSQKSSQSPLNSSAMENETSFSNYIVYVDESGDHSLQSIDDNYPLFVLAFCIFHKRHYSEKVVPALEKFKFNYFGHDQIILHEHEIRKEKRSL